MDDAAGFEYGPLVGHHAVTTAAQLLAAAHAPERWRLHYRQQCRAPVSLLAFEGIQEKDE